MGVPFIELKRLEDGFLEEWNATVKSMSENTQFMGGPQVASLEEFLRNDNGVNHAIGCANGTDALQLALRGTGVGRGDTVLLPDFTFWATFEAVVNAGADPVTVDVTDSDLQLDYDLFVQACEKYKPKAAMIVHLYGWGSARLSDFRKYCKENGIILIEDGAQAYSVKYKGESVYKGAEVSTISFYPAKVFGAAGDAGAVLTNNDEYAERIRSLENHGRSTHYSYSHVGWNSRLDALQACYLNISSKYLRARIESRRKTAERYRKELAGLNFRIVEVPEGYEENGYLNVCVFDPQTRPGIEAKLKEKGIGFGIVYPGAMSEQDGAKDYIKGQQGADVSRRLARSVLSLPLFPYMKEEEIQEVISVVKEITS